jgi:hypothetical protein
MNTTYTIANIEYTNDDNKAVTIAHWRATAQDGDYTASSYGTQSFEADPESPDYVAFADLTEEIVLAWVKDAMDTEALEAGLASQIEAQKHPTSASGLPWPVGLENESIPQE